jgi:serine/threonine protein kinase
VTRDYLVGPRIGQGGMAEVFLAVQAGPARFAKLVVQKRMRGAMHRPTGLGRGFLAEARLLARLSHPNLVQVLDVGWDERGPFVVVEYLSGETLATILRELVARGRLMPWPLVTRVAIGLAAGLAAAHGACDAEGQPDPILHRDLTPSNVIVCYSGAAKIIDFGIAKLAADAGETRAGTVKGKLAYLAPEILRGGAACPRTDLFQLGVLLFEALTGRRLFDAPSDAGRVQAVLHRPIPPPGDYTAGLPPALERIALALLARDPAERPPSADHVRGDLEEVLRESGSHVSEHAVGDWLRGALPDLLAERVASERECLRELAGTDEVEDAAMPEAVVMVPPAPRRLPRVAAAVALLAAAGLAVLGVSSESAPARRGPPPSPPAPVVVPLEPASPSPDAAVPLPEPEMDRGPLVRPPTVRRRRAARRIDRQVPAAPPEEPSTDNIDPWSE